MRPAVPGRRRYRLAAVLLLAALGGSPAAGAGAHPGAAGPPGANRAVAGPDALGGPDGGLEAERGRGGPCEAGTNRSSGRPGAAETDPGEIRSAAALSAGGRLYVPNQDDATVSIVDTRSRRVVRTVELGALGFPPDARPHHVAVEPDGSTWYVSLIGADAVLRFDREGTLTGRADFERPGLLALDPGRGVLWVGRSMKAVDPPRRIGRIRTADMSVEEVEVFLPRPHALALGPDGECVYAASLAANRIAVVERSTGRVEPVVLPGPQHVLVQFAVSPDGRRMVATGQLSGRLLAFDLGSVGGGSPLPVVADLEVGRQPWHPAYTPDGRRVVFGLKAEDAVVLVDAGRWEVEAVVRDPALSEPHGVAVSPDGRFAYVSNNNLDGGWRPEGGGNGTSPPGNGTSPPGNGTSPPGNVAVVDLEAGAVVAVIPVGRNPTGLALGPGS